MEKKKILIIDDEENFCRLVKKNLELISDFEVYIANDGRRGIKLAKKVTPKLILLDIIMPGMDGLQVLEKLKKDVNTMSIPIVMLTAKGDDASKIKAVQLYGEGYITKPIEVSGLKDKIEEVLARKGE